jgi:hypothetical protein
MKHAKWLVPVLVFALVGMADAKGKKNNNAGGVTGKIVSVSPHAITIQTGKSKKGGAAQQTTIHTTANTTVEIDKVPGMKVTDLRAGQKVVVQEDQNGIATDIKANKSRHGRHKKA